jgi:hypothetical protein
LPVLCRHVGRARYGDCVSVTAFEITDASGQPPADHHPIGISTGVFPDLRDDWLALVDEAAAVSTFAVELSALSSEELPGLLAYLRTDPAVAFRYVSVHAPAKNRGSNEVENVRQLDEIPLWVRSIVTHPDVLSALGPYRALGTRLVLENMDSRKDDGRTVEEMDRFFDALPAAGLCLDVAHAHSIDPSMGLAHALLDRFRSRLRHVHLSSLSDGHHVTLSDEDEAGFAEVLDRCGDVPWILEATPPERWTRQLKASRLVASGASALLG